MKLEPWNTAVEEFKIVLGHGMDHMVRVRRDSSLEFQPQECEWKFNRWNTIAKYEWRLDLMSRAI